MGEEMISNDMKMYSQVFSLLGRCTDEYLYIMDLQKDKYVISDSALDTFLLDSAEFSDASRALQAIVYPEDYPMLAENIQQIQAGKIREHNMEYRWMGRNGTPVWISCRGQVVDDRDGKPAFLIGRISDMSRKNKVDSVTGLYREYPMQDYLKEQLLEQRSGYLLQIGIDNFKEINERHGQEFGNRILYHLAECTKEVVGKRGRVFRMRGDEMMAVVCGAFPERTEAKAMYKEIRDGIDRHILETGHIAYYTISAGCVYFPMDAGTDAQSRETVDGDQAAETLTEQAGFALHQAKIGGKNMYMEYSREIYEKYVHTLDVQEELRKDIENGFRGFELYYQPVVNIREKKILGAEALLRWNSEKFGFMSPGQFIPLLEETGLIIPLGRWIVKTALEQCIRWQCDVPGFRMNVNLSFVQIKKSNALQDILSLLETLEVDRNILMLEVTESGEIESSVAAKVLRSFKEESIRLAIDDFGTGYSNLRYVKDMTFDLVKIDQSFIRNVKSSKYDYLVVKQFTELAHSLNLTVCYEGVETEEDFRCALELDPDYIQGYYFSRPVPASEFEKNCLNRVVEF